MSSGATGPPRGRKKDFVSSPNIVYDPLESVKARLGPPEGKWAGGPTDPDPACIVDQRIVGGVTMLQRTVLTCAAIAGALLLAAAPNASAQNILANPGFENGMPGPGASGWITFGNVYTEDWEGAQFVPYEGNQLVSMFGNWWGVFNASGIFQEFPTAPGETWKMSAKSRHWSGDHMIGSQAGGGNWVVQKIVFKDAMDNELPGAVESKILDGTFPTDVWFDNAPIMGTAPEGAVQIEAFILYLQPMWDGGAAQIDNVQLSRVVSFDLNPGSCSNPLNMEKMGLVPAAILGGPGVDVTEIDYSSLLLNGVAPVRHGYSDVGAPDFGADCACNEAGPDGVKDMTLKFKAQDIVMAIYPFVQGDKRVLTLTGKFMDGTAFEATDCIVVRGGPKDLIAPGPGAEEEDPASEFGMSVSGTGQVHHVTYSLPAASPVMLRVFDVSGRLVRTLVQSTESAGSHSVEWNVADQPSGIYFYLLETADNATTRKVAVLRR
jgi:hypothetical protein